MSLWPTGLVGARQIPFTVVQELVERRPNAVLDLIGASIAHLDVLGIGLNDFYSGLD